MRIHQRIERINPAVKRYAVALDDE
jgi:hypothetical protein